MTFEIVRRQISCGSAYDFIADGPNGVKDCVAQLSLFNVPTNFRPEADDISKAVRQALNMRCTPDGRLPWRDDEARKAKFRDGQTALSEFREESLGFQGREVTMPGDKPIIPPHTARPEGAKMEELASFTRAEIVGLKGGEE